MIRLPPLALMLLPAGLGLLAAGLVRLLISPEIILAFRVGLGVLVVFGGVMVSLLVAAAVYGSRWKERAALREIEQQRLEADAARRRFLRRLDHELKNPLAGLQIDLANLREAETPQGQMAAAENASRAVARLSRLLADLRKLAELEARSFERLPVDIPELLEEMIAAARALPAYLDRDIHLAVSRVPSPLQPVTGDRDLLGLMFYNLIDNSLKFTPKDGTIEIRVSESPDDLVIEVADNGPGIPPEEVTRVFEELFRGAGAQGTEGSGLGLALVRRIIDAHGGDITLASRQEEPRGTVFTVRLPLEGRRRQSRQSPESAQRTARSSTGAEA